MVEYNDPSESKLTLATSMRCTETDLFSVVFFAHLILWHEPILQSLRIPVAGDWCPKLHLGGCVEKYPKAREGR
jgi:hypothetical protein